MPAGVSWGTYLRAMTVGLLSMMAGSQTVHYFYHPLDGMGVDIERERIQILEEMKQRGEVLVKQQEKDAEKT